MVEIDSDLKPWDAFAEFSSEYQTSPGGLGARNLDNTIIQKFSIREFDLECIEILSFVKIYKNPKFSSKIIENRHFAMLGSHGEIR